MGCPDTVKVKCHHCNEDVFFQSKGGACTLSTYTLSNAPKNVMSDVNRHAPIKCKCGAKWVIIVGYQGRQLIEVK